VLPSLDIWGPTRGTRVHLAALAVCVLLGLAPGRALAQDSGDLDARVGKLEAEIADLKAMVGRLEALVRAKPSLAPGVSGAAPAGDGDLDSRVSVIETQIGALTNQIEMMGGQVRGADVPPAPRADADVGEAPPPAPRPDIKPDVEPDVMEALRDEPAPAEAAPKSAPLAPQAAIPQADDSDPSKPRWYGPRAGGQQPDGQQPGQAEADDNAPQSILPPSATGAVPDDAAPRDDLAKSLAALPDGDAQALYEQAYGDLLQRDYPAAETGFAKVVKTYPKDPLAGSAQYWVGETYYVRKQYKKAADSFLAAYRKYSSSDKAPDSLLKLGMSLAALGQKDAACSTFAELNDKFPDMHDHLRNQAKGEADKAGCK
jgi:tol-pal system protein YbgF